MKLYENKKVVKNDVEFYVVHNSILVTRKMPTDGARFLQMASLYSQTLWLLYCYFEDQFSLECQE